ncbi:MAG: roadblock/LC7 domain-containing protein [Promethearchaeota archaeon]
MSSTKIEGKKFAEHFKTFTLKCPTCKTTSEVSLPVSIKEIGKGGLTNVLIPHTVTRCGHAFQIFVDQSYRIRGYTRIDFITEVLSETDKNQEIKARTSKITDTFFKARSLDEVEDARLSEKERELKREIDTLIRHFTTSIPQVKALAVFEYSGNIIARALTEEINVEDISMLAGAMMAQSSVMGKSLKLQRLQDFTITSDKYRFSVFKAGELLGLVLYEKTVKQGLINLEIRRLVDALVKAEEKYFS